MLLASSHNNLIENLPPEHPECPPPRISASSHPICCKPCTCLAHSHPPISLSYSPHLLTNSELPPTVFDVIIPKLNTINLILDGNDGILDGCLDGMLFGLFIKNGFQVDGSTIRGRNNNRAWDTVIAESNGVCLSG